MDRIPIREQHLRASCSHPGRDRFAWNGARIDVRKNNCAQKRKSDARPQPDGQIGVHGLDKRDQRAWNSQPCDWIEHFLAQRRYK